jgi:hypothetical protein
MMDEAERIYRESSSSRGDLKYTYNEAMENQPVTLKLALPDGSYGYWPENANFPQRRFNPDRIPTPLIPSECLLRPDARAV